MGIFYQQRTLPILGLLVRCIMIGITLSILITTPRVSKYNVLSGVRLYCKVTQNLQ